MKEPKRSGEIVVGVFCVGQSNKNIGLLLLVLPRTSAKKQIVGLVGA